MWWQSRIRGAPSLTPACGARPAATTHLAADAHAGLRLEPLHQRHVHLCRKTRITREPNKCIITTFIYTYMPPFPPHPHPPVEGSPGTGTSALKALYISAMGLTPFQV